MKKIRAGMIGVGGFGKKRRELIRQSGVIELTAAYDLNPAALDECAAEDHVQPVGSYEDLLDFPGLEAVVISTGAKYHAEQAIAAMERGLHVFVEKPLCSTPDEMHRMIEVQKKTRRVVCVGHIDHYHDAFSTAIKRMIDSGELGKIATFEKTTCHNGGMVIQPGDWRGDPEKNPGGMLFQCGVHGIHELMFYFGPIKRVSCMMRYDVHTTLTSDVSICLLEFESGLIGTLNAYHVSPYRHTFNIFGTKSNIYTNPRVEGLQAYKQTTFLDNQNEAMVPFEITGESSPCESLKSFYKAIREGGEPYPSLLDGARSLSVVFAADISAKTGKVADVPPLE